MGRGPRATAVRADGWTMLDGAQAAWRTRDDGRLELRGGHEEFARMELSNARRRNLRVDGDGCLRTRGQPKTMRTEIERWGEDMAELCDELGLDRAAMLTMWGITGVEAGRSRAQGGMDIFSIRYEGGFHGFHSPDWEGEFSAGLVQTTMETARAVVRREGLVVVDLHGNPRELEPGDLCIPRISLHLGLIHLKALIVRFGIDPVLLQTAWNTGGVYEDMSVRFGLYLKHSDRRVLEFMAWHNDALAVLKERGAW